MRWTSKEENDKNFDWKFHLSDDIIDETHDE